MKTKYNEIYQIQLFWFWLITFLMMMDPKPIKKFLLWTNVNKLVASHLYNIKMKSKLINKLESKRPTKHIIKWNYHLEIDTPTIFWWQLEQQNRLLLTQYCKTKILSCRENTYLYFLRFVIFPLWVFPLHVWLV